MSAARLLKPTAYMIVCIWLSGCMAVALAPAVGLVGGMAGNNTSVRIDEATIDPELREVLPSAAKLAFVSVDLAAVYAAEHMESNSDYLVSVVPPPETYSPSQARRYMEEVCVGPEDPDIVFFWQAPNSDAGAGTTVMSALTGRLNYNLSVATDVLRCETGWRSQFTVVGEIRQGIYNADLTRAAQILGHELSAAMLRLAGKMAPAAQ